MFDEDTAVPASGTSTRPSTLREAAPGPGDAPVDPQHLITSVVALAGSLGRRSHAGLTILLADGVPETVAATDDIPVRVDWLQQQLGEGPAFDGRDVVVSPDLASDGRWPVFGRMVASVVEVRSMVSIAVPSGGPNRAMLNFYATLPGAFNTLNLAHARMLGRFCGPTATQLCEALATDEAGADPQRSSRLATALGMVMASYRVQAAPAFALLQEASQSHGTGLFDFALEVVKNGRLPLAAVRAG